MCSAGLCVVLRLPHELSAAISHLLAMLRAEGAIPLATVDTKHDRKLAAFRAYLRDVPGWPLAHEQGANGSFNA